METTDTNMVQATYTYGNDLISAQIGEIRGYYHYDALGTTRQLTGDNGTVVTSYIYDSFGNKIASTGTIANTYGFTGEQQFGEADSLVFLRARYYEPDIGRFMSRDPIGYKGGLNLYTYVQNNPIMYVDLSGKHSENRACHYACTTAAAAMAVACSRIPSTGYCLIAKIMCYAAVGIFTLECNWGCDHPTPPWDPIDPGDPFPPPPRTR